MLFTQIHHHHHNHFSIVIPQLKDLRLHHYTLHHPLTTKRRRVVVLCSSSLHHSQEPEPEPINAAADAAINEEDVITRRHNYKSAALLRRLSQPNPIPLQPNTDEIEAKLLELSLARRRTPQFPGSIYVQSPGDVDVGASLPPLQALFEGGDDDEEMIMKALEIRRKVTLEIFDEAMRRGKFGITYTTNLASRLSEFLDYVMIQAASMKQLPEFSQSSFNVRAKTFIDSSNVVPIIRWLKHNALSYPQIAKLLCMSKRELTSINRIVEWMKSIHMKGRFVGTALIRAGGNVFERSNEELDEIVGYLESKGVRKEWMGYVVSRCPELLSFTIDEVKIRSEFYTNMGMNTNDFGTMVYDYPKVLGHLSLEEMNQKVSYLKEFGLSNEDVGKLLAFRPQLMGCSIEERWKPLVKYLYYLGIKKDGMRRILTIKPMVFCIDLESNIVTKVQFLLDIGVQNDAVGNMLVKFPQFLTYSLNKRIRPVVIFLLTKAGVSEKDIGKVIALGPELLGCSVANKLDPNLKYLISLGIPLRSIGEMIADFPMLLRYNIDILRPKYRYLRRTMVRPLKDLIEFPRFFSYSLEGRIIPRHKVMVEKRVNFKLRYMLATSDEEFDRRVCAAVERREKFESGVSDEDGSDSEVDGMLDRTQLEFSRNDLYDTEESRNSLV